MANADQLRKRSADRSKRSCKIRS